MIIPDYQSLMLPVLSAAQAGEVRIGELVDQLADQIGLSSAERTQLLPSGKQTLFANRVHWAKTYLGKAGVIEATKRGHFQITERGRQVLASQPIRIDNAYLNKFEEFRQFRERSVQDSSQEKGLAETAFERSPETPDETMRIAHAQIETALAQDMLGRIRTAPPDFFERLIVNLLLTMGYGGTSSDAGRALGRSGDGGVDGVIDQDALGLDRVYIQAKRYAPGNTIGPGEIRDFFGALDRHKAAKGLFVTTSSFTSSARETAEFLSKRIVLIDGEQFSRLMVRYEVGCRVEEVLQIKKLDEEFFDPA